jgi:hypothetical protein
LVLNSRSQAVTLGLAQGKFHVWLDPDSHQPMARNLFHGNGNAVIGATAIPAAVASTGTNPAPADSTGKLTVATLKQLVQGGAK